MQVDITDLFIGVVPAIISCFIAVNKSKIQIDSNWLNKRKDRKWYKK